MNLHRPSLVSTALVLALSLAACSNEAPPPPRGKPEVTVVTLQPEAVTLTRELPGRVSPFLVAEVRPQVGGLVRERLFEEGSRVEAGQPLYQLDDASSAISCRGGNGVFADRWARIRKAKRNNAGGGTCRA